MSTSLGRHVWTTEDGKELSKTKVDGRLPSRVEINGLTACGRSFNITIDSRSTNSRSSWTPDSEGTAQAGLVVFQLESCVLAAPVFQARAYTGGGGSPMNPPPPPGSFKFRFKISSMRDHCIASTFSRSIPAVFHRMRDSFNFQHASIWQSTHRHQRVCFWPDVFDLYPKVFLKRYERRSKHSVVHARSPIHTYTTDFLGHRGTTCALATCMRLRWAPVRVRKGGKKRWLPARISKRELIFRFAQ